MNALVNVLYDLSLYIVTVKQIDCLNHRVVTLVAEKLTRQAVVNNIYQSVYPISTLPKSVA